MIPELPDYLTSLGGSEYKGYIIWLFTLSAAISRPFSGRLADTIGRIPVMVFGAGVCFILGFIYPAVGTIFGFLQLQGDRHVTLALPVRQRTDSLGSNAASVTVHISYVGR